MKKTAIGKFKTVICLLLSLCLVLPFAACDDGPEGEGGGTPTITLNPAAVSVTVGEAKKITATLSDLSGKVTWTSDDPDTATVTVSDATDKAATITGVKAGSTTIKATVGDVSALCTVNVTAKNEEGDDPDNPGGDDPDNPGGDDPDNPGGDDPDNPGGDDPDNPGGDDPDNPGGDDPDNPGGEDPDNPGGEDEEGTAIEKAANQGEAQAIKEAWTYFYIGVGDSEVTVNKCELVGEPLAADNKIVIDYEYSGVNWAAFNLNYMLNAGKPAGHEVTFKMESSVAGNLIVSAGGPEQLFDIAVGENNIAANFEGAMLWLRFGSDGRNSSTNGPLVGKFTITGIQIGQIEAQQLKKPSFGYDPSSKIITIDDTVNEGHTSSYKLNFYKDGEKKSDMAVVSGQVVEPAGLEVGSYKAKLVAVGDGIRYTDSDESDDEADIEVESLKTTKQLRKGDIATAQANMLEWVAWIDDGLITASQYDIDTESGEITIDYEYKDAINRPWYGMRLAYAFQPTVHIYRYIKLDITVESDCWITIAENVVELHAGKNEIYADISKTGAVCIIGLGHMSDNSKNVGGKFILSNIEFTDEAPPEA
ncbi:MAG: Ig-like domain-containing protein [Clostridiales bacterium]|nr:Ig-like domain-containing protein [Clostridiales bacterium]